MESDDIRVFLVDDAGADLGRFEVTYSRQLVAGQHVLFQLHPDESSTPKLFHVLGVRIARVAARSSR